MVSHHGGPGKAQDFNDVLDEINVAEQRRYSRMGFTRGYSLGEEAGWREGYLFGVKKGASLATEIGFYQGYTSAWLGLLEKEDQGKARKVQALRTLLDMTRQFPVLGGSGAQGPGAAGIESREDESDMIQRLTKIRAKFKQVHGLLSKGGEAAQHPYQQQQRAQYHHQQAPPMQQQSSFGSRTSSPFSQHSRQASFETQQAPSAHGPQEMSF